MNSRSQTQMIKGTHSQEDVSSSGMQPCLTLCAVFQDMVSPVSHTEKSGMAESYPAAMILFFVAHSASFLCEMDFGLLPAETQRTAA